MRIPGGGVSNTYSTSGGEASVIQSLVFGEINLGKNHLGELF